MAYIRVVYKNKGFDYVPVALLDILIRLDQVTHFYRPSEKKWISTKFDRVRGAGGRYQGPERRSGSKTLEGLEEKAGEGCAPQWLERLWRHIGSL
jgi:hypothetical protein